MRNGCSCFACRVIVYPSDAVQVENVTCNHPHLSSPFYSPLVLAALPRIACTGRLLWSCAVCFLIANERHWHTRFVSLCMGRLGGTAFVYVTIATKNCIDLHCRWSVTFELHGVSKNYVDSNNDTVKLCF